MNTHKVETQIWSLDNKHAERKISHFCKLLHFKDEITLCRLFCFHQKIVLIKMALKCNQNKWPLHSQCIWHSYTIWLDWNYNLIKHQHIDLKENEQNTSPGFTVSTYGVKLAPTEYAIPSPKKSIVGRWIGERQKIK